MKRILALSAALLILSGCAGELTHEKAAEIIGAQTEFRQPFCAPFHLAPLVLTGDNHSNPKAYVQNKYGALVDAGLVETTLGGNNSWRTILRVDLTEKGRELSDPKRSADDMHYVQVCSLKVDTVLSLTPVGKGDTMLCRYRIVQHEPTLFGEHMGFMHGKQHVHERTFVKGTYSWNLLPL